MYQYFCRFELENMSIYLYTCICNLTCTLSDTIRPCQNIHQNAPGGQILNFQNTFDRAWIEIRMKIQTENFFGILISMRLTSHLQSMTPLKLNTWLVWWIKPLPRSIKMNLIDMRIFSTQPILYLKTTSYSLTAHSYWKFKFKFGKGCLC
jgi:hypothetical protein